MTTVPALHDRAVAASWCREVGPGVYEAHPIVFVRHVAPVGASSWEELREVMGDGAVVRELIAVLQAEGGFRHPVVVRAWDDDEEDGDAEHDDVDADAPVLGIVDGRHRVLACLMAGRAVRFSLDPEDWHGDGVDDLPIAIRVVHPDPSGFLESDAMMDVFEDLQSLPLDRRAWASIGSCMNMGTEDGLVVLSSRWFVPEGRLLDVLRSLRAQVARTLPGAPVTFTLHDEYDHQSRPDGRQ